MTDFYPAAAALIIAHEGGYVNDKDDPGGETQWGISKRAYPSLNIKTLTHADALGIYRRDYWDKLRCGSMPWAVALVVFDAGVNQGVGAAAKFLQRAAGVTADGQIGPMTLGAVGRADPVKLAAEIQAIRMLHYASLSGWAKYGLGWSRRAMSTLVSATQIP